VTASPAKARFPSAAPARRIELPVQQIAKTTHRNKVLAYLLFTAAPSSPAAQW